ncbi:choice-of-anchor N protein [Desulfosoma sp.]|uniref:choice-of-anchor N protein n=1 Tax=Desulfosoma sp. TaxID=2603217 RepID=UPI00404A409A
MQDFSNSSGNAKNEQKTIKITIPSSLSDSLTWMHFDVMALETTKKGKPKIVTHLDNNPGSHDVTWNSDGGSPPNIIPEPATMVLLGSGLFGLGWRQRRRSKNR